MTLATAVRTGGGSSWSGLKAFWEAGQVDTETVVAGVRDDVTFNDCTVEEWNWFDRASWSVWQHD